MAKGRKTNPRARQDGAMATPKDGGKWLASNHWTRYKSAVTIDKSVADLSNDPRWRRFNDGGWTCVSCQQEHTGIFDLACDRPDYWPDIKCKREPNSSVSSSQNFLSEDFCVLNGENRFVRCVLQIPILGTDEVFGYGVWSSLSPTNFQIYVDAFDDGDYENMGPWFGWFANNLKGYPDTINLKCNVCPRDDRLRPLIQLHTMDHPLVTEQRDGITFDRLLDIYALHGHDVRRSLLIG